MKILEQIAAS